MENWRVNVAHLSKRARGSCGGTQRFALFAKPVIVSSGKRLTITAQWREKPSVAIECVVLTTMQFVNGAEKSCHHAGTAIG
jgi:hypothetical protein